MKKLIPLVIFFFALNITHSQNLHVFNADVSDYPVIRANFYAFDENTDQIINLVKSDFEISEDGNSLPVTYVSCPPVQPPKPVSVAMSIDVSGSMSNYNGEIPVELGKTTARLLCSAVPMPPSEFALQTCDSRALIRQDFTTDRNRILSAIDPVTAQGGNDFVEHLLNPRTGLLNIAKKGSNKRVAVIYTDAFWPAMTAGELQQCLDTCEKYDIEFYAVLYTREGVQDNGIKSTLRAISDATGGILYENITNEEAAKDIAYNLKQGMQGGGPCTIEWVSDNCDGRRTADISVPALGISDEINYTVPYEFLSKIDISPVNSLHFRNIEPGYVYDSTITITAKVEDINIQSISLSNPYFSISDYGGSQPPFTLPGGSSRDITLTFSPVDSSMQFCRIVIESDACIDGKIYANGGHFINPNTAELKLTHPNGGELFPVGDDTLITWEGILPTDTVSLRYSIDNGNSWRLITDKASGLEHKWDVPNTPSDSCLMKVEYSSKFKIDENPIVIPTPHRSIRDIALSPDGTRIATCGMDSAFGNESENDIIIWDIETKNEVIRLKGHTRSVMFIDWSNDGTRIVSRSWDSTMKIWDASTGMEIASYEPYPVFSYGTSLEWSPDDQNIMTINYNHEILGVDPLTGNINNKMDDTYAAYTAVWSPQGDRILSSAHNRGGTESFNAIWDFQSETDILMIPNRDDNTVIGPMDWSPDGSRFATQYSEPNNDYFIRIYDAQDGSLIRATDRMTFNTHNIEWDPKNRWIALNQMILIVLIDATTMENDTIMDDFYYDSKEGIMTINSIEWSNDGRLLAACGNSNFARIWVFDDSITLEDISDSLWAIDVPEAAARDVNMGREKVGNIKDSVLQRYIVNTGQFPIRIDSVFIDEMDKDQFDVISGFGPYSIDPGEAKSVEFRFAPTSVGIKTARIIIRTQSGTMKHMIEGIGVDNDIEILTELIDFGPVWVGAYKDTVEAVLRNTGAIPVEIDSTKMLGPDLAQFEIISGGDGFTIPSNGEHTMQLRFSPNAVGRTSGQIGFYHKNFGSPEIVRLFGEGMIPSSAVWLPDTVAEPGAEDFVIELKAKLLNEGDISLKDLSYDAEIEMDAASFRAMQPTGTIYTDNAGKKKLSVTLSGSAIDMTGDTAVIGTISGTTLIGDVDISPLTIKSFNWNRNDIETDTIHGSLRLQACIIELKRLESLDLAAMQINPNPADDHIEISIESGAEGEYTLNLYNLQGVVISSQSWQAGEGSARTIRLNLQDYQSGYYQLVLEAPWQAISKPLFIVR